MKPFVSLYQPVEIEIEGTKYPLRKLNRARFKEIAELQKQIESASSVTEGVEFTYVQLKIFVDAPPDVIDDLDIRDVRRMIEYITDRILEKEGTDEKNLQKPGDVTSP